MAAHHVGLVPFLVVGTVRLCAGDPFHFLLGRRLGLAAGRRRLGRLVRLVGRPNSRRAAAAAMLVRPIGRHLALAGAAGVPSGVVAALDVVSTIAYLALVRAGGLALG